MRQPEQNEKLSTTFGTRRANRQQRSAGFTLVEVILAIGISTGLLVVALVFYQQAAELRNQLINEAERLASIRLIFDRLASDLRTAFAQPKIGFTGTSDSMTFIISRPPDLAPNNQSAASGPASDLRLVSYMLTAALQGTNFVVTGLDRTEEPLRPQIDSGPASPAPATILPLAETSPASPAPEAAPAGPAPAPLAETIRFVRFRYWDGTAWLEGWNASDLPAAIEINLGAEPLPTGELPDAYPYERFRRVVHLPTRTPSDEWAGL